jgi:GT2 family glycosyltransferase
MGGVGARADAVAITVVVPVRNVASTIARTLAALAAQDFEGGFEVIVVDSGSDDGTVAIVESAAGVAALLRNPGGEPAGSRNLGAAHARGEVLAFTDGDCEPGPGWLRAGLSAFADADIVQGTVMPVSPPGPFDRTVSIRSEYGLYETANLFVRRSTFERLGGFEPVVALDTGELAAGGPGLGTGSDTHPFGEDVWFVWRARRAGARTAFSQQAIVRHAVVERGALEFIGERARCRYFPPLVALIPELRGPFLHRRWFLSAVSLRFDLALAGLVLAACARRVPPGLLAAPYGLAVVREARRWPGAQRALVAASMTAADAVTFAALVRGSVHSSTPVL